MGRHAFTKGVATGIAISIALLAILFYALPYLYLYTENRNFAELREKSELDCDTMPLHCLSRDRDLAGIHRYVEGGRDLELTDNWGRTALYWSLANDRPAMTRLLLASGADPNTKDENGTSILLQAVVWGRFDIADQLLTGGADINAFNGSRYPETALHHCVMKNKPDCVEFLLEHGANPFLQDAFGYTVFERVRMHEHISDEIGRLLSRRGDTTGKDGR